MRMVVEFRPICRCGKCNPAWEPFVQIFGIPATCKAAFSSLVIGKPKGFEIRVKPLTPNLRRLGDQKVKQGQ